MSDGERYLLDREEQGSASRVERQCGPNMGSLRIYLSQQFMTALQKRMAHSMEMAEHEVLQDAVILF
jgi:hypothetical protein